MSNVFDQFDSDENPSDVNLLERARLNRVDAYYRGSLAGASSLMTMSQIAKLREQGAGDEDIIKTVRGVPTFNVGGMRKLSPEESLERQKMWLKEQETAYNSVISDLSKYDRIKPWTTDAWGTAAKATNPIVFFSSPEAIQGLFALGGQLAGNMQSPESWLSPSSKLAMLPARVAFTGAVQGAIQAATDPLVQTMNIKSGVQKEYSLARTALSAGLGVIVGGGLHMGGELLSSSYLRGVQKQMGLEDPAFRGADFEPLDLARPEVREKTAAAIKMLEEETQALTNKGGLTVQSRRGADTRFQKVGETAEDITPRPEVKTLHTLSQELATQLDMPLQQGRIRGPNIGQYDSATGVARVQEIPDFETTVHESGHFIEQKIGKPIRDLQTQFASELERLDLDGNGSVREGFAEYMRRFVGNPRNAAREAPGFDAAFRQFMANEHPDLLNTYARMQEALDVYKNARPEEVIGAAVISETDKPGLFRRILGSLKKDKMPTTVRTVMSKSYQSMFDENAPYDRFVRAMAKTYKERTGQLLPLKDIDNPAYHARMLHEGARNAGLQDAQFGVTPYHEVNPHGVSLFDAIAHATGAPSQFGNWDPQRRRLFSNYLVARMGEVAWEKRAAGLLPHDPVPFSLLAAQKAIKKAEQVFPEFRNASEMVNDWNKNLLQKVFDAGLITKERFEKISDQRFYVPLLRDVSEKGLAKSGASAEKAGGNIIKRMLGSERNILDPIESMMTQSYLVNRAVRYNDLMRAMNRLSKIGKGGKWFEEVPATEARKYVVEVEELLKNVAKEHGVDADELVLPIQKILGDDPIQGMYFRTEKTLGRGEPLVHWFEDGVMKVARVGTDKEGIGLYALMTSVPKTLSDVWSTVVTGSTALARAGVVTNPAYMAANYIRDQFQAAIFRNDYIPMISGLRGIVDELHQGRGGTREGYNAAHLYAYMGGVSAGAVNAPIEKALNKDINALAKRGFFVNRLTSLRGLMDLSQLTEAGTRNSVFAKAYNQGLKQGLNEYEAAFSAAFQAKDLLDFNRHGSHTLAIRNYIPFINANFQGMDKARRTMLAPLFREMLTTGDIKDRNTAIASLTKFLGVSGVLGFGWAALNMGKDAYRDASPTLVGTHVVIPFGDNKVFLFPKPFELGLGFTMGEYAAKKLLQDDPRAMEQMFKASMEAIKPPNPLTDIPLMKTTVELQTGKSLFTGRDIVPERLQALPPSEQYNEFTSGIAKKIGKITGWSPMKVDYALGSFFTNWGRDVIAMSAGTEDNAPVKRWEDSVFARRFIKDPNRTSDVTTKFWEYMAKTTGKYNQANAAFSGFVQRRNEDRAYQFLNSLPADQKVWVTLQSGGSGREAAFSADDKRVHPLRRAYDAVSTLNGLRQELIDNSFAPNDMPLKMTAEKRRDLIDGIRELAQIEMRNALVILKEPGYKDRQLYSVDDTLAKIRAMSPEVGDAIAQRYATRKIYKTEAVARLYDQLKTEVIRNGTDADLGPIVTQMIGDGYEFGAERVKRQMRRKIEVKGTGQ